MVLKSGSLKFLEPSGPVQTCIGIGFIYSTSSVRFHLKLGVINSRADEIDTVIMQ
jgi:hypothetical protein